MINPMHILLIAPAAPPKNSPEAMQVGRFLDSLDPKIRVTLVTTPIVAGWEREDVSLLVDRPAMTVITAELPFHKLTERVLKSRTMSYFQSPDTSFWLPWFARQVVRQLTDTPDVIYSRSAPFSSAILARRIKSLIHRPWLMHLSDPWSDSPYRKLTTGKSKVDRELEKACFAASDLVTLTTEGQADFYRRRYPSRAEAISVTPNMMPLNVPHPTPRKQGPLRLVHTGALYGNRDPETILAAMRFLYESRPEKADRICVDFYGNMSTEMALRIGGTPNCVVHSAVSFSEASKIQSEADVLISIEPDGDHPLLSHFLLSKVVDYVATARPILAITIKGSETERLCRSGIGWAFAPGNVTGVAETLLQLLEDHCAGRVPNRERDAMALPYQAKLVTAKISELLHLLVNDEAAKKDLA